MRKIILFLIGFSPLLVGFLMNDITIASGDSTTFLAISIGFLVFWFVMGILSYRLVRIASSGNTIANFPTFLAMLLVVVQEIFLNGYWDNVVGTATQLFMLPLVAISSKIPVVNNYMWLIHIVSFIIMYIVFILGNSLNNKAREKRRFDRFNAHVANHNMQNMKNHENSNENK